MILITGATGLVGATICRRLVAEGKQVRAIKRNSSRLELLANSVENVEWFDADLLDIPSLNKVFEGVDQVIHSAAMISFAPRTREKMYKVNIEGTKNMVNLALATNVKRFIHISSVAAIGRGKLSSLIDEKIEWEQSENNTHYGKTKYQGELEVWRGQAEGLSTAILNPSTIIGAGFWNNGSSAIINEVYNGLKFYTPGTNGFVDVRDVANVTIKLLNSNIEAERFIVSSENLSMQSLMETMASELNVPAPSIKAGKSLQQIAVWMYKLKGMFSQKDPIITKETAELSSLISKFSNEKVRNHLGYRFIPIKQSIADAAAAYLKSVELKQDYGVTPL